MMNGWIRVLKSVVMRFRRCAAAFDQTSLNGFFPGAAESRQRSIYSLETVFLVFGSFLAGLFSQQDQAEHFSRNDEVFRT